MATIIPIDVSEVSLDIHRDLSVHPRKRKGGPPERIDGMTVGIVSMSENAPHGGEVHPDGDEILYVISGRMRVTSEADPEEELVLGPGQACIVPKGEWHNVIILEPVQMLHITPGPNGAHRPLA